MEIVYTKHAAIDKPRMFKKHNFNISKKAINETITTPEHEDESQSPKIIASKSIDEKHILRVVYRVENDRIIVITFYPAEKERYY